MAQRPIEQDWEKILGNYDIRYQQFFTMSLVGEHIHRLMINAAEIYYKTEQLMLATIQSEETIKRFGLAAEWFGVKYREYFNKDTTPKVHLF